MSNDISLLDLVPIIGSGCNLAIEILQLENPLNRAEFSFSDILKTAFPIFDKLGTTLSSS